MGALCLTPSLTTPQTALLIRAIEPFACNDRQAVGNIIPFCKLQLVSTHLTAKLLRGIGSAVPLESNSSYIIRVIVQDISVAAAWRNHRYDLISNVDLR